MPLGLGGGTAVSGGGGGGFGGGGGGGGNDNLGGGGGGGYSGGGGGGVLTGGGGGGGSYLDASATDPVLRAGIESGNGSVVITEVSATQPPAVTPEPSSLILLGTGLLGFTGFMRKRFA